MTTLQFTGERFIPGTRGEIWIEHWHRYHFAAAFVAGRRVLDVACGEGYGSALLARKAVHVTGVDVSKAAVDHAAATYAAISNLRFVEGSCARLPMEDASVDVAVSFETLEHITGQAEFMAELARVLKPAGLLLMSCPNKIEYTDRRQYRNEFHVKELYRAELAALVASHFPHAAWFGQKPTFYSVIAPETLPTGGALVEVTEEAPAEAGRELSAPLYFIVAASRDRASVDAVGAPLHVLSDRGDWVHRDYEKVYKWMTEAVAERDQLREQLEVDAQPRSWLHRLRALFS
jgi:ubiquinone/menaquinone biosynthesis C-methylase UbiE